MVRNVCFDSGLVLDLHDVVIGMDELERVRLAIFASKMLVNIVDIIFEDFEKYKELHLEALKRTLRKDENAKKVLLL